MKVTMRFDLPEEDDEHKAALHGQDYKNVLESIDHYLRGQMKHGGLGEAEYAAFEDIRGKLHHFLDEYGVDIY
jgi:hypothetical protein